MNKKCENCKIKIRSEEEKKALLNRLNRIEGQIRGLKNMVNDDNYCTDIIMQVSAASAALNSFNKLLLSNHIRSCVANDLKNGSEESLENLLETLKKLMK